MYSLTMLHFVSEDIYIVIFMYLYALTPSLFETHDYADYFLLFASFVLLII